MRLFARILQISLVIFAMLFGAGNLMMPLRVGLLSGDKMLWGFLGFALTGVLLPLTGLLSIIEFDGDYNAFFGRLGRIPGAISIFLCIIAIGPLIVMPRIVTLSYEMMQPFLPAMTVSVFAIMFLILVFLASYKPGRLLTIIGNVLSPIKVASLFIIVIAGLFSGVIPLPTTVPAWTFFKLGAENGYFTLDLLGTIFFGSIVVKMLKGDTQNPLVRKERIKIALFSGICAAFLLGLVYLGMCILGAYHGQGLEHLNEGQLFSTISFRVLGSYGQALIGFTVFIACFTTTVALSAVVTDYFYTTVFKKKVKYAQILMGVLAVCFIPASFGLGTIMSVSIPIIKTLYPVLIVITACNGLYTLFGFNMIRTPALIMLLISLSWFYL